MADVVFRCQNCNYLHEKPAKPRTCPKCGAPYTRFLEIRPEKKEKAEAEAKE